MNKMRKGLEAITKRDILRLVDEEDEIALNVESCIVYKILVQLHQSRFEGADVMQVRVVGLVKKSIRNY